MVSQTIRLGIFLITSDKPEKIKEKDLRTEYGADWVKVFVGDRDQDRLLDYRSAVELVGRGGV